MLSIFSRSVTIASARETTIESGLHSVKRMSRSRLCWGTTSQFFCWMTIPRSGTTGHHPSLSKNDEKYPKRLGIGSGQAPLGRKARSHNALEESILAGSILTSLNQSTDYKFDYVTALRKCFIQSRSRDWVTVVASQDAIVKLRLVSEYLSDIPVNSLVDLVLTRYIGGLRLMAQYDILKPMGVQGTDLTNFLKQLILC